MIEYSYVPTDDDNSKDVMLDRAALISSTNGTAIPELKKWIEAFQRGVKNVGNFGPAAGGRTRESDGEAIHRKQRFWNLAEDSSLPTALAAELKIMKALPDSVVEKQEPRPGGLW